MNSSSIALGLLLASASTSAFTLSNRPSSSHAATKTALSMSSALIVQNKGGGHGELGFQLAKTLQSNSKITSITILQDDACKDDSEPFQSYATDIPDVTILKAPLSSDSSLTAESLQATLGDGSTFDYIWDNSSKKPEGAGKAICDLAKEWNTKLFTYVSSAGMYNPDASTTFPMSEASTPIKESAGQHLFDTYAGETLGLPYVSFRPQYIYGPKSNKHDYIDWFFDRLSRDLPLPIPGDGTQKVSLTNSEDVASLLASVLNDEEAAVEQRFFNCGTDQLLSYNEVAALCAAAAGKASEEEYDIFHYDSDLFGKATFPFRMTDFYVAPDMAKDKLKWEGPKHSLKDDLEAFYYESYVSRGGPTKKMDLMKDWEIVVGCKSYEDMGSVYDKWDPLEIDTSNVKELTLDAE